MNAPTTKVQNHISDFGGLTVNYNSNYIAVASEAEDYVYDEELDNMVFWQGYDITLHNGLMPAFETRRFDTLQELANGMKELADLRVWRKCEPAY